MNAPVPGLAPRTLIGTDVARPNAKRLLAGRGAYVDDKRHPRELHAAFVRSPHAHARIVRIDLTAARKSPGVFWCGTGADVAKVVSPWVGVLSHFKGMKSAPQYAVAVERATWQGEAVAVIVAQTRAQAEDAIALVEVDYEALPAVTDMRMTIGDRVIASEIHERSEAAQSEPSLSTGSASTVLLTDVAAHAPVRRSS